VVLAGIPLCHVGSCLSKLWEAPPHGPGWASWAFAGAEALADRFCIADVTSSHHFGNLSLSPEYFMDCDSENAACGGGLIDDAWIFLAQRGLVDENCDPFLYHFLKQK
jgi:hypothetical protein